MNETSKTKRRRSAARRRAEDRVLEQRVEERTRELTALLEVTQSISSTLALEPLLDLILEQLLQVMHYRGASIAVMRDGALETLLMRDSVNQVRADEQFGFRVPLEQCMPVWEAVQRGEPVLIGDVRSEDDPNAALWRDANGTMSGGPLSPVRAWLAAPLSVRGEVFGMLAVSRDVPNSFTPREVQVAIAFAGHAAVALQNARLHDETEQRTRELAALLDVSGSLSSTLELGPLLGLILDQLKLLVDYTSATAITREGGRYLMREYRGPQPRELVLARALPTEQVDHLFGLFGQDEAFIIPDVWADTPAASAYRATGSEEYLRAAADQVGCLLSAPLVHKGQMIGSLTLSHRTPGYFTEHHAALTQAVADQATAAIENARLYEQEHRTAQELASLLEVSNKLGSTLDLDALLDVILEQIKRVAETDAAVISTYDGESIRIIRRDALTPIDPDNEQVKGVNPLGAGPIWAQLKRGEPVIIGDVRGDEPLAQAYRNIHTVPVDTAHLRDVRSWMAVPLMVKEEVIGFISIMRGEPNVYEAHHAQLVTAIATQAAAAIENARLHTQTQQRARELATLLEVSRAVASTLELTPLLNLVLEQLKMVVDYRGATVLMIADDELLIAASRAVTTERETDRRLRVQLRRSGPIWDALNRGETLLITDVRGDEPAAVEYRTINEALMDGPSHRDIRAWMAVPLAVGDRLIGMISASQDVPGYFTPHHGDLARAVADQASVAIENARLYEEEQRTSQELGTLLEVSHHLASTLELEPLLNVLCDQLHVVANYTSCAILIVDGDTVRPLAYRGPVPTEEALKRSVTVDRRSLFWEASARKEPVIIGDIFDDSSFARAYRQEREGDLPEASTYHVRSWLSVPLIHKDEAIGSIAITHDTPHYYTPRHAELAAAIATQAAAVIVNARLYEEEHRTSLELSTLLDTSRNVSATLELEPLLGQILDQLKLVVDYVSAGVVTREGDRFMTREYRGPLPREIVLSRPLPREMFAADTPEAGVPAGVSIIPDVWDGTPEAREYLSFMGEEYLRTVGTYVRCVLSAPLVSKGKLIGSLVLTHDTAGFFTSRHAALVRAIADQATVAIENARLYEEAHKLAALEERQRLARELHDSVSQALFGIALGARTARRRLDQDPARVGEALDYVLTLAEAGLTEMRALIFELRPEALEKDGLVVALTRHAAATRARYEIAVELDLCDEPDVPLATKEALYRIAQEAMYNTVKHARANRIDLILVHDDDGLTLDVRDDGVGFDPEQHFAGHLGLHSMRERIAVLGGQIEMTSAPGTGTRICATVA